MKKRFLILFLALLLSVSLFACSSGNDSSDSKESNTDTEEMSQSEWIEENADNTEDGYEVVDAINIDNDEMSLKYEKYEIIDGTDNDDNPIKELVAYFTFTNKTSTAVSAESAVSISAYQNGIELTNWITDGNDAIENVNTEVMDGREIEVAFVFELEDTENPVKMQLENSYIEDENIDISSQQQEIDIAK